MQKRMTFLAAFEDVCGTRPENDRPFKSMKPGERYKALLRISAKYHDGSIVEEIRKRVQPGSLPARQRVPFDYAVAVRRDTWRGIKPDMHDPEMVALKQRLAVRWALQKSDEEFGARGRWETPVPTQGMDGEGI